MDDIIEDEANTVFRQYDRIDISNILVLTGGGTTQAFFALGACGCLHDNGMLQHDSNDVISVVSGGALLATFLEMCYLYKYDLEEDWFDRYVRKGGVHACVESEMIGHLIAYLGNLTKLKDFLFDQLPAYKRSILDAKQRGPVFEYNYIDTNLKSIISDHTDLINVETGHRVENWHLLRAMRCGLPLTKIEKRGTFDAGAISNIPSSTIFKKYNVHNQLIIVKVDSKVEYKTYPPTSVFNMIKGALSILIGTARDSVGDFINRVATSSTNIIVSTSNKLRPSKDKYHKDLFQSKTHFDMMNTITRKYNGLSNLDMDYAKVMDNEGYLQMYYSLEEKGLLKPGFEPRIPNPEVYNADVGSVIDRAANTGNLGVVSKLCVSTFESCADVYGWK